MLCANPMKKMSMNRKSVVLLLSLLMLATQVACDDDDDDEGPRNPEAIRGYFPGYVEFTFPEAGVCCNSTPVQTQNTWHKSSCATGCESIQGCTGFSVFYRYGTPRWPELTCAFYTTSITSVLTSADTGCHSYTNCLVKQSLQTSLTGFIEVNNGAEESGCCRDSSNDDPNAGNRDALNSAYVVEDDVPCLDSSCGGSESIAVENIGVCANLCRTNAGNFPCLGFEVDRYSNGSYACELKKYEPVNVRTSSCNDKRCYAVNSETIPPTSAPTLSPTKIPTSSPSESPTTNVPTDQPSRQPSLAPSTLAPSAQPTGAPTVRPGDTHAPTRHHTGSPTGSPSMATLSPTHTPSKTPSSSEPTEVPTRISTNAPIISTSTLAPTTAPVVEITSCSECVSQGRAWEGGCNPTGACVESVLGDTCITIQEECESLATGSDCVSRSNCRECFHSESCLWMYTPAQDIGLCVSTSFRAFATDEFTFFTAIEECSEPVSSSSLTSTISISTSTISTPIIQSESAQSESDDSSMTAVFIAVVLVLVALGIAAVIVYRLRRQSSEQNSPKPFGGSMGFYQQDRGISNPAYKVATLPDGTVLDKGYLDVTSEEGLYADGLYEEGDNTYLQPITKNEEYTAPTYEMPVKSRPQYKVADDSDLFTGFDSPDNAVPAPAPVYEFAGAAATLNDYEVASSSSPTYEIATNSTPVAAIYDQASAV